MTHETPNRDHLFKPGQSGNPSGRPKGLANKRTRALEALASGHVDEIVQALIDKAKEGDATAAKPILDRLWPIRKGARVEFELPSIAEAGDLPTAIASITVQVAAGEISPDEASLIVGLLEAQRKAIETADLAERVSALEERLAKGRQQ